MEQIKEVEGYTPLGKRLLIKQLVKENKTKSGIIILSEPVDAGSKLLYGVVVKTGDTHYKFNIGDCVSYMIYRVEKFNWNGEDIQLVDEENIVAVVNPELL